MPVFARWLTLLLTTALLAACSSTPPAPPVTHTPVPSPPAASGAQDVLFNAMAQVGTPYRYGGSSPQTGFDCSGLIQYVYRGTADVHLPRTSLEMSRINKPSVSRQALAAGIWCFSISVVVLAMPAFMSVKGALCMRRAPAVLCV